AGGSESSVVIALLTSPEFTAAHPDDASFVASLFPILLNRQGTVSEQLAWQQVLRAGTTRAAVASFFLSSPASFLTALADYYQGFLGGAPDPLGQRGWLALMQSGRITPTAISVAFLSSSEYLGLPLKPDCIPATTTVVVSSANPSAFGQAVTFTATV